MGLPECNRSNRIPLEYAIHQLGTIIYAPDKLALELGDGYISLLQLSGQVTKLQYVRLRAATFHSFFCLSRLQTKRRASLFWLEGRAKEHALKAYDSLDKHTPRRHPKLIVGYRLASHVLSVCRVVVLRDKVCNRWPILSASPQRFSSWSYEVRCVPVSDGEYYTKSNGRAGKILGSSGLTPRYGRLQK